MSGAYVAKPAVAVTPDPPWTEPPPGWDWDWPFPGPFPPGYAPEYTFPMASTATIKVGSPATIEGSIRDHVEFLTNEPDVAILSATIDGEDREISPALVVFSEGVYWNITDSFSFLDLTRTDEGKTIVVTGVSAISGESITGTTNIAIYAYEYSLVMSGTGDIDYDEAASVTVSLRDHETLGTPEPTGATLTWTATLDGSAVDLKFSGGSFSALIESEYSDLGTYWGGEEDIEFDLDEDDRDKTVTLSVESTVWGDRVSDTMEIEIKGVYVVSYSASVTDNGLTPSGGYLGSSPRLYLNVYRTPDPSQRDQAYMQDTVATWDPETAPWVLEWNYDPVRRDEISENVCTAADFVMTAVCESCVSEKIYRIVFLGMPGGTNYDLTEGDLTFTVTVVLSDDSEQVFSVVKHMEPEGPDVTAQLLIDVDEGELTWSE